MKVLIFFVALISSSYSVIFNCGFSQSTYTDIGTRYTCRALNPLDVNVADLTEVRGTHLINRNNSHVQALVIESCTNLTYIPKKMHKFFPDLIMMQFTSCRIVINGGELNQFPNLESFSMAGNQLVRIPGNFFNPTPKIRFLNFATNQLQHVGDNLLEPLLHIRSANFAANPCVNHGTTNSSVHCLVGLFRLQCPDIETPASPNGLTTTTITPESCDMYESVCYLKEQNDILKEMVSNVVDQNAKLKTKLNEVKELLAQVLSLLPRP